MKVSVIGIGKVGSSLAFLLSIKNFVHELVLVGSSPGSVMGDVLDLRHGQLFVDMPTRILAGTVADTAQSDVIAICASAPVPASLHNRLDLGPANTKLLQTLLPDLADFSPGAKMVIVSNPVDVLVHFALEFTGFPANRVMGTGTLVDSARFRQLLAEEIDIHMEDIRAYILGEHGDSQFPAMSCAYAGGELIEDTPSRQSLFIQASQAGFEVFRRKGFTNYAIALAAADIIRCIATDAKHTMPISLRVDGYLGIDDVCLSLPAVVGKRGIERVLHPKLDEHEQACLRRSADAIRHAIQQVRHELRI